MSRWRCAREGGLAGIVGCFDEWCSVVYAVGGSHLVLRCILLPPLGHRVVTATAAAAAVSGLKLVESSKGRGQSVRCCCLA